jgi:hypothetical protein
MDKKKNVHKKRKNVGARKKPAKKTIKNKNKNKNINKNIITINGGGGSSGGGSSVVPIPYALSIPNPIMNNPEPHAIFGKNPSPFLFQEEPQKISSMGDQLLSKITSEDKPKIFNKPVDEILSLSDKSNSRIKAITQIEKPLTSPVKSNDIPKIFVKPVDEMSSLSDKSNSRIRAMNQAKLLEEFTNSINKNPFSDFEDDIPPLVKASDMSSASEKFSEKKIGFITEPQISSDIIIPKARQTRSDKGIKRKPYNTKKRQMLNDARPPITFQSDNELP